MKLMERILYIIERIFRKLYSLTWSTRIKFTHNLQRKINVHRFKGKLMFTDLKEEIKSHEGFVNKIYKDHLGFPTIFFGHLITPEDNYEEDKEYPKEMGEKVFELDFQKALTSTENLIGSRPVNHTAKEVLIEMVYQMGVGGVSKFKKMWKALGEGNYKTASEEMLSSRWANQTPHRCSKMSKKMLQSENL